MIIPVAVPSVVVTSTATGSWASPILSIVNCTDPPSTTMYSVGLNPTDTAKKHNHLHNYCNSELVNVNLPSLSLMKKVVALFDPVTTPGVGETESIVSGNDSSSSRKGSSVTLTDMQTVLSPLGVNSTW